MIMRAPLKCIARSFWGLSMHNAHLLRINIKNIRQQAARPAARPAAGILAGVGFDTSGTSFPLRIHVRAPVCVHG